MRWSKSLVELDPVRWGLHGCGTSLLYCIGRESVAFTVSIRISSVV